MEEDVCPVCKSADTEFDSIGENGGVWYSCGCGTLFSPIGKYIWSQKIAGKECIATSIRTSRRTNWKYASLLSPDHTDDRAMDCLRELSKLRLFAGSMEEYSFCSGLEFTIYLVRAAKRYADLPAGEIEPDEKAYLQILKKYNYAVEGQRD